MNGEEKIVAELSENDLNQVVGGTGAEYERYMAKMKKKYNETKLGSLLWMMTPEENDIMNQWFNHKPGQPLTPEMRGTLD